MSLKVGIVGAAGYAGAELIRLVLGHPEFELVAITSNADAGQPLSAVYPSFAGVSDLVFTTHDAPELKGCDAVFLAVPHTAAMAQVPALLAAGVSCFDLSADYRLSDPSVFEAWYAAEHTSPELLKTRTFGLPELFCQDLETAASSHAAGKPVLVACAGCYPTATSLAAAPAVRAGWVAESGPVIVDAISGVTGAGKSCTPAPILQRGREPGSLWRGQASSYARDRADTRPGRPHRLHPALGTAQARPAFHGDDALAPQALDALVLEDVVDHYKKFYAGRTFVRVLDAGQQPKTASVVGTNAAQIGLALNKRAGVLVATGAIDNLCKGAAGQAVQCANIVFGFDERRGLPTVACPV